MRSTIAAGANLGSIVQVDPDLTARAKRPGESMTTDFTPTDWITTAEAAELIGD